MAGKILGSGRIDRIAMAVSGLCLIHCVATVVLLGIVSSAAAWLGNPLIHEAGLALATVLGAVALVGGARRHGALLPTLIGSTGLASMATALALPHGGGEALFTMAGVSLLAAAHYLNRRAHA